MALCVGSAIYIPLATFNYLGFYSALSQIGSQVDKLLLVQSQPSLEVQVSVTNPSDYSGFTLTQVTVQSIYFYEQANHTNNIFVPPSNEPNASQSVDSPLGPRSSDHVTILIPLSQEQTRELVSFNSTYSGQILGEVNLRVDIGTFLISVIGTETYTQMQDIPLSPG